MAEITAIKTGKAPVETITVKLTPAEARELAAAHRSYYPFKSNGTTLSRSLERAANGDTGVLAAPPSPYAFADMVAGRF